MVWPWPRPDGRHRGSGQTAKELSHRLIESLDVEEPLDAGGRLASQALSSDWVTQERDDDFRQLVRVIWATQNGSAREVTVSTSIKSQWPLGMTLPRRLYLLSHLRREATDTARSCLGTTPLRVGGPYTCRGAEV